MSRNVLIVVEGGRIQEILCDDPDIRVTVKNFDDVTTGAPDDVTIVRWPVALIKTPQLESAIRSR